MLRSFAVREVTKFSTGPDLHKTYDIVEDLTTQDSLLLLTSTGLFRATNSGTTENVTSWSEAAKYDLISIFAAEHTPFLHSA